MRRSGVPLGYVTVVTFSSINSIFCRTLGYQPHIVGDLNNVAQPTHDTSEVPNWAVVTP
jgi:hypothetical protein